MYIRSYQIHNVLNVYRKQLSSKPAEKNSENTIAPGKDDRISISADGQRQSIMDKISSEIVERIAQTGPENQFESALAEQLSNNSPKNPEPPTGTQDFKYTVIDEDNRKITNTLPVQGVNPHVNGTALKGFNPMGEKPILKTE